MTQLKGSQKSLSDISGIVDIDDNMAEGCSGGASYTVNLFSGEDGKGEVLKSFKVDERPGYDVRDKSVSDDFLFGLGAQSFSISAKSERDKAYRLTAFSNHTSQTSTVGANKAVNFKDLNGLGLQTVTVNKVRV